MALNPSTRQQQSGTAGVEGLRPNSLTAIRVGEQKVVTRRLSLNVIIVPLGYFCILFD